jgi:hypothetical protein
MAWSSENVKVNGDEVVGQVHSAGNLVTIPFVDGIEAGSSISVGGKSYTVERAINVGGRDETLDVFIGAGASKKAKAKKVEAEDEGETPET